MLFFPIYMKRTFGRAIERKISPEPGK